MNNKGNAWALLPLLVFIVVYVSSAIIGKKSEKITFFDC